MKKKFLVLLSIIILSLTFISCSKDTSNNPTSHNPPQTDTSKPDTNTNTNTEKPNTNDTQTGTSKPTPDVPEVTTPDTDTEIAIPEKEMKSVRLYFYDVINDNIVYYDDVVEVTDKAVTNALINALKYPSNENVTPSIPKSINVTSAKLDKENNTFTVDFPSNLVSEMNLGSGPESSTLKSIVNTLGYNFGVDNVIITLAGNPYSSGHIALSYGESFKVSLDNTVKLD